MYFPDFSIYSFLEVKSNANTLNIGWLDANHSFSKNKASEELLNGLFEKCLYPINKTRGYHLCQFCKSSSFGLKATRNGKEIILGSAEIWIKGKDGKTFAAPNLIYHYVAEHDYEPPNEFIDAILSK